jgi:hypothetical protein
LQLSQLVRNLCCEAIRRLRVTEAAAAHALRCLRADSAQQQHRIRLEELRACSAVALQPTCSTLPAPETLISIPDSVRRCSENELSAAVLQLQRLQWLEQEHTLRGNSSDVDSRLISAAKVLKAQQNDVHALQEQNAILSMASVVEGCF